MPSLSPATRHRLGLVLFAAAVVGALLGLATFWRHVTTDPLADVRAYYDAAARLNAGQPLYPPGADTNLADFYRYPPLLAIALRPFAVLPFEAFALLWEALVVATFVGTLWLLGVRRRQTWLAVGVLGLPIGWALAIGQAHVPMTFLVLVGTPLSVALAANLKVLPILVAVWWLGRRDWRALAVLAGWMGALAAVQLVLEPTGSLAFPAALSLDQVGDVRSWSPYAISPVAWAVLAIAGGIVAIRLAPTRYGWAAAVAFSVLVTPRLLTYQLMALLAARRRPAAGRG